MDNEKLNTQLYEKMFEEQEKYRGWLLGQPPEEILNHTYEYTVREDILMALENNDISDEQAAVLLKSPAPLGDIFKEFENRETGYMDIVLDCITDRANTVIQAEQEQRKALLATPLYKYPATYAREHDELPQYRASHKANIACRDAIDDAIRDNYRDNCLGHDAAKQVIAEFGFDRTLYVLANTVREKDWDGRIDHRNKDWARTALGFDDLVKCSCMMALGLFTGCMLHKIRLESFEAQRQLIIQKETDVLTGLANRRKLFEMLAALESKPKNDPTGVLMLDIDHFKQFNDCYGHAAGDECLKQFGALLREFEHLYTMRFYRYGGEEFVALVWGCDEKELLPFAESYTP